MRIDCLTARIREWRIAERGTSSIALFILMLPLIVGIFGFGFDIVRWSYAKNYAQGRMNMAIETAMTYRYTNANGNTALGQPGYADAVTVLGETYYQINTAHSRDSGDGGLLSCADADMLYSPTEECELTISLSGLTVAGQNYDFCAEPGSDDYVGVRGQATETINTVFLKLFGVDSLTFTVRSFIPLRDGNC